MDHVFYHQPSIRVEYENREPNVLKLRRDQRGSEEKKKMNYIQKTTKKRSTVLKTTASNKGNIDKMPKSGKTKNGM